MAKGVNKINDVLSLLGLSVDEEFKLSKGNTSLGMIYKVADDGKVYVKNTNKGILEKVDGIDLNSLILGDYTINKLPWKPNVGVTCWSVNVTASGALKPIRIVFDVFSVKHLALFAGGMLFPSENDAKVFAERAYMALRKLYIDYPNKEGDITFDESDCKPFEGGLINLNIGEELTKGSKQVLVKTSKRPKITKATSF